MRHLRTAAVLLIALAGAAALAWLTHEMNPAPAAATAEPYEPTPQQIERGAYLARAGNCIACHTARGGAELAGGKGIATPFGTVYSTNLTPDAQTGLGRWTSADFRRALTQGRSKDGRLLYPAFPYPSYTQVTHEDADAMYAYFRSRVPVARANRPHELRFPYNLQASLAVWRALYFTPGEYAPDTSRSAKWNRGAYLVRGLGHCAACHAPRNALGAVTEAAALGGGMIPMQGWYAPSLSAPDEAGVASWPTQQVVDLLRTGTSHLGSTLGPMAEVVLRSTQYLSEPDLRAMAVYLKDLPRADAPPIAPAGAAPPALPSTLALGARLYEQHCAQCHGDRGQGAAGLYPPLAGNRAVTMASPANTLRIIIGGGFLPATAGNPRPFGMPPFGSVLDDAQIAALATYLRGAWGHAAAPVSELDVLRAR